MQEFQKLHAELTKDPSLSITNECKRRGLHFPAYYKWLNENGLKSPRTRAISPSDRTTATPRKRRNQPSILPIPSKPDGELTFEWRPKAARLAVAFGSAKDVAELIREMNQ